MSVKFEVKLDLDPLTKRLQSIANRLGNLGGVHAQIGNLLVDSTNARFGSSTAPDGSTWQPLSATTLALYVSGFGKDKFGNRKGGFSKALFKTGGSLNKRGDTKLGSRKPLVASGTLAHQTFYTVSADGNVLSVGSPMEYSAMQQFGQKKGASGRMKNNAPIPLGDVPPRPFIGLSSADESMMRDQYARYITEFAFT